VRFVIDHLAVVRDGKDEAAFGDLADLVAVARFPNVAAKASALPRYSSEAYPYRRLHAPLKQVFDAFGPTRFFWGTDMTGIPCTYREAVTLFTEELPWLTGADRELVMGRALCDWLGWAI
jgi:predicted TIM-barrel fold metal-dependent hydrolase